jgi:hypothetical protein
MNKILKASLTHYQAQRDFLLSELDIVLNQNNSVGDTQKSIELIRELSIVILCINNIESIISDNKQQSELNNLMQMENLADQLEKRLKNTNTDNP